MVLYENGPYYRVNTNVPSNPFTWSHGTFIIVVQMLANLWNWQDFWRSFDMLKGKTSLILRRPSSWWLSKDLICPAVNYEHTSVKQITVLRRLLQNSVLFRKNLKSMTYQRSNICHLRRTASSTLFQKCIRCISTTQPRTNKEKWNWIFLRMSKNFSQHWEFQQNASLEWIVDVVPGFSNLSYCRLVSYSLMRFR